MQYNELENEKGNPVAIISIYKNGYAEPLCKNVEDIDDVIAIALDETVKDFHYELMNAKIRYTEILREYEE